MINIVAFLQNPWFKVGTSTTTIENYLNNPYFRKLVLGLTPTGKKLQAAFGLDTYMKICWDNSTQEVVYNSTGVAEADLVYMKEVIDKEKPKLILTFGNIARDGLALVEGLDSVIKMSCQHPACRKPLKELNAFANRVKTIYPEVCKEITYGIHECIYTVAGHDAQCQICGTARPF